MDAAALGVAPIIYNNGVMTGNEYGATIDRTASGTYIAGPVVTQNTSSVVITPNSSTAADIHNHIYNPTFSTTDIAAANATGMPIYLVNPAGDIIKYDPGISIFGWHPFSSTTVVGKIDPKTGKAQACPVK